MEKRKGCVFECMCVEIVLKEKRYAKDSTLEFEIFYQTRPFAFLLYH